MMKYAVWPAAALLLAGAVTGASAQQKGKGQPAQQQAVMEKGFRPANPAVAFGPKLGPEYADAYMRFYLRVAGRTADGDLAAAFARAFPLPEPMEASIARQVSVAFGGI